MIYINSVEREEIDSNDFYQKMQIYKNRMRSSQDGINMYSFSMYPNEYQPSGSINFNKIDDSYIQMRLNKLINYQNPILIKAYAVHYNVLRIIDGLGSLVFYS